MRDDDAGWENDRLFVLLDVVQSRGVPIDVAAIPAALTSSSAADLRRRLDSSDGLVSVHQHGLAHANHEPDGRKSEFGPSRSLREQRRTLRQDAASSRTGLAQRGTESSHLRGTAARVRRSRRS